MRPTKLDAKEMSPIRPNKSHLQMSTLDRALIKAIGNGLPIVSRPYAELAKQLNCSEQDVISGLQRLTDNGDIKRYGVVVRHQELGYTANGMVVWDIPDDKVDELGQCIGKYSCVTLSYRRPRHRPQWPYNLFTMVHGQDKQAVIQKVKSIADKCGLQDVNHTILFSTRRFKQRGASYSQPAKKSESNLIKLSEYRDAQVKQTCVENTDAT